MSDDNTNRWSVAVPLALLVVGGCALFGCIPIPGNFGNAGGDVRPEKKIGKSDSDALIRLGVSDRERVRQVLGEPTAYSDDGRAWVYQYDVASVYLFWPLCFGANRGTSDRLLALRFNEAGVLRAYKVTQDYDAAESWAGRAVFTDSYRRDLERQKEREAARASRTMTRPTTREATP